MRTLTKGEIFKTLCCDECVRRQGMIPKKPPDSGANSWRCEVCGHRNIGSSRSVKVGDWLFLHILQDKSVSGAEVT